MDDQPKHFAFVSPQGTLVLKDDQYIKRQGKTAEEGGQVIYVIEMGKALAKLGHRVDVFTRNYETEDLWTETHPEFPELRMIHVPTKAEAYVEKEHFYPYYPEYIAHAEKFIEQDGAKYDAVVGHYADGMFLGAMLEDYLSSKSGNNISLMGVTHSLGMEKAQSLYAKLKKEGAPDLKTAFNNTVNDFNIRPRLGCELAALTRMDGVGSISPNHTKILFDQYKFPEDQIALLPGGVDIDVFFPIAHTDAQRLAQRKLLIDELKGENFQASFDELQDAKIVFGYGRLVKAKGVFEAVQSMEHILKQPENANAFYVYAGGNIPAKTAEEKELVEQSMQYARERGYEDRIVFLGRRNQHDINKWLNASNVYLHAAYLEPYGLAPQEAAATGIPVVVSKEAGVSAFLENNEFALQTDPHSPKDIAKQVGRFLDNPLLAKRITTNAVKLVNDNATWVAKAQQLVDFAGEIAQRYLGMRGERTPIDNPYWQEAQAQLLKHGTEGFAEDTKQRIEQVRGRIETLISKGPDGSTQAMRLDDPEHFRFEG